VGNLLITLSGARPEVLSRCPSERIKFQSLGWALLITSGMATLSMWFALTSVLGLNAAAALPVALAWGLIILGIDRWLITSLPADGGRRWAVALPRLVLALLLGSLISTPIVLRVFQSEINAQVTVIKEQRADAFLRNAQHGAVDQQVAIWTRNVDSLEKVITSGGQVPINPGTDPQVQSLTAQRTAEQGQETTFYQQWQCQLYGGSGCTVKGNGPLAQASENSYNQAKAQVASLTQQIQQREQQLEATNAQSRAARVQQAQASLPAARGQLRAATARANQLQASFDAQNKITNGLLIRLEALNQLSSQGFTLNAARILLFLLFLVIECLPVTVKLLQQPGNYEKILKEVADRELRDARRDFRLRPRTSQPGGDTGVTLPLSEVPAPDDRAARHAMLQEIWNADDLPEWGRPGRAAKEAPEPEPSRPADDTDDGQLDQELRRLRDLRMPAEPSMSRPDSGEPGRRGPGLPYGDDDL
jgi:Domain of unknown function (DUF4407)